MRRSSSGWRARGCRRSSAPGERSGAGIEDRAGSITRDTRLFGELPELDSLGVVELAAALEDRFDIVIEDEDFTGEVFESVGTLTDFIDSRRTGG